MSILKNLENRIQQANKAYWEDHDPIMSDAEYDSLIERLRKLNPDHPLLTKLDDGTMTICMHPYPMLSLRKVYNMSDMLSWIRSVSRTSQEEFLIQPKFDGCTCRITDGKLYTRGDGTKGEDITRFIPYIKGITIPDDLGELVITGVDFKEFFASGRFVKKDGSKFANQRNATAGILGRVGDLTTLPKVLTFVSYDRCYTLHMTCEQLQTVDIDQIIAEVLKLEYPLDGLVFKLADRDYSSSLGLTAHHPRGQMAYKFDNCSKESEITQIVWQIGRTGILTPVVKINPIEIHGSNIDSVTAHDYKHVKELDICVGDRIVVSRAGDVIPFIELTEHTTHTVKPAKLPEVCPCCGKKLSLTNTGVDIYCSNPECSEKNIAKLVYACKVLEMDGWAYATIKEFKVTEFTDLVKLSLEEIKRVFPGKQGDNLYRIKDQVLTNLQAYQLLTALGIPLIGKANAKLILNKLCLNDLVATDFEIRIKSALPLSVMSANLLGWMADNTTRFNLCELLKYLEEHYHKRFNTVLSEEQNKTICFTGKMSRTRSEMEKLAQQKGYTPVSTVTRNLTLLVCANKNEESTKLKHARSYGVDIATEEEFLSL